MALIGYRFWLAVHISQTRDECRVVAFKASIILASLLVAFVPGVCDFSG